MIKSYFDNKRQTRIEANKVLSKQTINRMSLESDSLKTSLFIEIDITEEAYQKLLDIQEKYKMQLFEILKPFSIIDVVE